MDIWHVVNSSFYGDGNEIWLWRMQPGIFQVIEPGSYMSLLTNASYVLIHKKYEPVFQNLTGEVECYPVIIHDKILKIENADFFELSVLNTIDPKSIHTADSSGLKAWNYNEYLFVSGGLKFKLESISDGDLQFSAGFSFFAGRQSGKY